MSSTKSLWLVCSPKFYTISYEINAWMNISVVPDRSEAERQWQELHNTFLKLGAHLETVAPHPNQPDMVFTANAGLVRGKNVVLSKFQFDERRGEEAPFKEWFEKNGFQVHLVSKSFEGEGDALFANDLLVCGYGFRSDEAVFTEVQAHLGINETLLCELVDPRFYHLDTCFCYLDSGRALIYPPAFSKESLARLKARFQLFEIPESDATKFACNAVAFGKNIVIPAGCQATEQILATLGYQAHGVKLDEFIKAGGAAKCLCLKLDNT
jgi:N-dimethylarginine dimethylaminohydrolase